MKHRGIQTDRPERSRDAVRAAGTPFILLAVFFLIIIAAGLWALLRTPAPATPPALPPPAPDAAPGRGDAPPPRPSAAPVDVEPARRDVRPAPSPSPAPGENAAPSRSQSRARRFTSHTELLAWIQATEGISDPDEIKEILVELGRELAAENFAHALDLAGGIDAATVRQYLYQGIFAMQAATDPRGALRAARTLSPERVGQVSATRYRAARKDYHTALLAVLRGWATVAPEAALDSLDEIPAGLKKQATIAVYGSWGEAAPQAALAEAEQLAPDLRTPVLESIFNGWARTDPAGAARYAASIDDAALRNRLFNGIAEGFLENWDNRDPRSHADWAVEVFPDELLRRLLPPMYTRWSESNPVAAAEHALQLNRRYTLDIETTMGNILRQWAQRDLDAAAEWIDQRFRNDEDYVWAVTTLLGTLRYKDPAKTARLLEKVPFTYADGTAGASEVARLMAAWCIKDPAAAVDWAEGIENRDLRIVAIKSLAANWASRDYEAAFNWARRLSDPNTRAYALSNVALRQAMHKMEKPVDWIPEISERFVRVRTAAGFALGSLWRVKDETSAELVKEQLAADALDVARITEIIGGSELDEQSKSQIIDLLY